MKRLKKAVSLLLIVAMMIPVMTGCGKKTTTTNKKGNPNTKSV